jgi:hypothetical protein
MELTNKSSTIDNKFSFTIAPSEIYNNETINITYKNLSDQPLHFTLLSLNAECEVRVIGSEVTLRPYETCPPIKKQLFIPDKMEVEELEDVLMAIVTTEQTGFEALETPGLDVDDGAGRGDEGGEDEDFEDLEDILGFGSRHVADPGSSWQTHQVIVKTKKRVA